MRDGVTGPVDSGAPRPASADLAYRIRRHALCMTSQGGSSHIGSVLSMADIVAVLYGGVLRVDPANPRWPQRDRFILSKGHAGAGVYAALAERGFLPVAKLETHYQDGSDLSGHVSHKGIPGVELSTGSLGHGLPVAAGMAYAAKLDTQPHRVFVLVSDGECDEGSNWEAILFAPHHRLDNLVVIVDYNKIQSLKPVAETLGLEPFADKWRAFGWAVSEVDGHDHAQLEASLSGTPQIPGKPTCVIAHTVKGKGVSFMENTVLWHYRSARGEEFAAALRELDREVDRTTAAAQDFEPPEGADA
jgi:transketolase